MSHKGSHRAPMFDPTEAERRRQEREALRQVTRELHEAAQAAKEARKELAAEVDRVRGLQDDLATSWEQITKDAVDEVQAWITNQINVLSEGLTQFTADAEAQIKQYFSRALGCTTPEDFMDLILEGAAATIRQQLEELEEDSRDVIKARLKLEKMPPQVFVTTDPALAPKGTIIIDGRR